MTQSKKDLLIFTVTMTICAIWIIAIQKYNLFSH
jgi:hypothetical protein